MAHERFRVEVLTPEGGVFDDEVEQIPTRTQVGSVGILARHQPLRGLLAPTALRLYRAEADVVRLAQGEGYLQVGANRALVLVEEATPPEDLDAADLQDRLRRAEQERDRAAEDSEERRLAERERRRLQAFLDITRG